MMIQQARHIEGPWPGSRVYLTLTDEQWEELAQLQKDNPKLSQWECRQLQRAKEPSSQDSLSQEEI